MSSPTWRYRRAPDLRVREVPELDLCLVYVHGDAELYTLNATSWFLFDACDGRTEQEIAHAYRSALGEVSAEQAEREVRAGLENLVMLHVVEREMGRSSSHEPTRRIRHAEKN